MDAPPIVGGVESGPGTPATPGFKRVILFSADVRKITMDENPGQKFGEISPYVAERWRMEADV